MRWRYAQQSSGTAGKAIYESVQMCRFKTCRCCFGNACERSKCLRHAHVRQEGYSNRFTSSLRQILLRAVPDTPRQMAACRRGISNRGTSTSRVSTSGFDVTRDCSPAFLRGKTLAAKIVSPRKADAYIVTVEQGVTVKPPDSPGVCWFAYEKQGAPYVCCFAKVLLVLVECSYDSEMAKERNKGTWRSEAACVCLCST